MTTDKRIGNQFWKMRAKHGRDKIISDPGKLSEACVEYFQWVEDNPLQEEKVFHNSGVITRTNVSKMRAMTIGGLCIFLDICENTWANWRDKSDKPDETEKDFLRVITQAELIIRNQKFTGAAADMLNPNIIARDLGLADKVDKKVSGSLELKTTTQVADDIKGQFEDDDPS